jgi:predicted transcriptional regulator
MVKLKTVDEYVNILTTVRIEQETDRKLKLTVKELDISQSVFIRHAIKDAIAAAGVVT